jgi:hypothetical protein
MPLGVAQGTPSGAPAYEFTAIFAEHAPRIDGRLNDEIWQRIDPITDFVQVWPEDGAPATERTEARIAYDRDNLYFAFRFYDRSPELIRAKNLERGGRNDRDDHAYIGLDTFRDGRNAYLFEMNALGTQDDATVTDEGLTIDSFSWDAVFRSETVIDEHGWTLEVSIPFRQLRFPKGEELEFGLMLSRMINRKNERVLWPPIGMEYGGSFGALAAVSRYGVLKGLKNIRRGKNIEIKPYLTAGAQQVHPELSSESREVNYTNDFGMDFKYGLSSNLTLDLSVNTDFAQVETDNVQLNLSRFSLFFPEKREFFLERSGLFEHGNARSTQTFFSRRIGLTDRILAGARMTGQLGRFSVGMMNIETGGQMNELFGSGSANNTVARVRTRLFPRATAGAIFTNREQATTFNRALGVDAKYRFGSSSEFNAWYTNVWDADPNLQDNAGHASLTLQNDLYGVQVAYTSVGENYHPALGFVRRLDMRQYSGHLNYSPVVNVSSVPALRRLRFMGDYDYVEGQSGDLQSTETRLLARAEFNRRDFVQLSYQRQFERLEQAFAIRPDAVIPAADYTFSRLSLRGDTDSSRRVYGSVEITIGDFFNGHRTDFGGSLGFRQSQYVQLEGSIDHSIVDLSIANGRFDATTVSLSVLGAVSRKLFTKTLIQYDNFSRDLQANLRIDWIHTPGSDLFLVYNTSYHIAKGNEPLFDPRTNLILNDQLAIVKLTYLIML